MARLRNSLSGSAAMPGHLLCPNASRRGAPSQGPEDPPVACRTACAGSARGAHTTSKTSSPGVPWWCGHPDESLSSRVRARKHRRDRARRDAPTLKPVGAFRPPKGVHMPLGPGPPRGILIEEAASATGRRSCDGGSGTCGEDAGKDALMRIGRVSGLAALALVGYDALLRPWMLDWGTSGEERRRPLPGDDIVEEVMTHHTRAVTIDAPPEAVWPWLLQIGDRRGGFYSYDWLERATATVPHGRGK